MQELNASLPSLKRLAISTVIAMAVAALVLLTVVLPAEYQLDPLGTGKLLGLDALTNSPNAMPVGAGFNSGRYEIKLRSGEEREYKALMEKDGTIKYSWEIQSTDGGGALFDFHGEPTAGNFPKGYFKSYGEGEGTMSKGVFVAPFTGRHGWYWQNVSAQPITITVELAGSYSTFDRVDGGAE